MFFSSLSPCLLPSPHTGFASLQPLMHTACWKSTSPCPRTRRPLVCLRIFAQSRRPYRERVIRKRNPKTRTRNRPWARGSVSKSARPEHTLHFTVGVYKLEVSKIALAVMVTVIKLDIKSSWFECEGCDLSCVKKDVTKGYVVKVECGLGPRDCETDCLKRCCSQGLSNAAQKMLHQTE